MGRVDPQEETKEYQQDANVPPYSAYVDENQPTEIEINYNVDQQASCNVSNPTEPQVNVVQDQYPPQQVQQQNPVPYPPPQQANSPMSNLMTPSHSYPPPGMPMQYNQNGSADEPMQFPPPPRFQEAYQPNGPAVQFPPPASQEAHQPYGPAVQFPPNQNQSTYRPRIMTPSPLRPPQAGTQPWRAGILDCMEDPQVAVMTFLFPCVTFGQIAEIVDTGNTTCATAGVMYVGLACLVSGRYRTKLRTQYNLLEDPAPDWAIHCMFEQCALCQEYRELNLRGLDPAIGWQGNLARNNMLLQQQKMGMQPPMNQTMNY